MDRPSDDSETVEIVPTDIFPKDWKHYRYPEYPGKFQCKVCGSDHFYVGAVNYQTVIMCHACSSMNSVHEG